MIPALLAVLLADALWNLAWVGFAVAGVLALGGRVASVGLGLVDVVHFTVLGAKVSLGLLPVNAHVSPLFLRPAALPNLVWPREESLEQASLRDRAAVTLLPLACSLLAIGLWGGLAALASAWRGVVQVPFPLGPEGRRLAGELIRLAATDLPVAVAAVLPKVAALGVIQALLSSLGVLLGQRAGRPAFSLGLLVGLAIPAGWLLALLRA